MIYRYLAGYRKGDRIVGEKRYSPGRVRHHRVDNGAGRMFWCDCYQGFRINGRTVWPMMPTRTKRFRHFHGSRFHKTWWHRERATIAP